MTEYDIGYNDAVDLCIQHVNVLGSEAVSVMTAAGRTAADDISAMVDSPSVDASLRDGYAVISSDLSEATPDAPVRLDVTGSVAAGGEVQNRVRPDRAVRVLTGAPVPAGADAVLAEEFAAKGKDYIHAEWGVESGRHILPKGSDVKKEDILIRAGHQLSPPVISLLVAGGVSRVPVFQRPAVGLLATGSEVLLPGSRMESGKLFASNVSLQNAWLSSLGMETKIKLAGDRYEAIENAVNELSATSDVLITSGGTWKGDRDLIISALKGLGANILFHRTRMRPGKGAGFALYRGKPVFCLPGGPTSNEIAFLLIALPAILKMAGGDRMPYLQLEGRLEKEIRGQRGWTQFIQCRMSQDESGIMLRPMKNKSRLVSMARTQAIATLPEDQEKVLPGGRVPFICLDQSALAGPFKSPAR